ncbi:ABC transporter substrate-binding protein [Thalassomonas actiniarum]|uniref:ABC transporter substrate-binding protein n=1 Tax=Thalassomonas actiniarum TaxID=485447 RepID=UPI000AE57267|nr:PotD/PotF family extracellular solute-binding protein [Thalassomonas actiniarum]
MWHNSLRNISGKIAIGLIFCLCSTGELWAKESLRIFTWDGYVTKQDLTQVNKLLSEQNYDIEAKVITPFADDADQMFNVIRAGKADVTFLTLFFIKMQHQRMLHLLQPINTQSPRLSNYQALEPSLTDIPMGMVENKKFYIPWGGGAYGFYVNRNQVEKQDIPVSLNDLWLPKWQGRVSYNLSQEWYNIGITLMSMGKSPFYINELVRKHQHARLIELKAENSDLITKLTRLYANAGHLWHSGPVFHENLHIVSSWGPEIMRENTKGNNWQLIQFKEGSMVWLDTINFVHSLKGKKLEAAEIFANYFIGKQVQNRIVTSLSMVAASSLVESNPIIDNNPTFFQNDLFVPPYDTVSGNIVTTLTERALAGAKIMQKATSQD